MNVLILGSGGREHAFGWKLSQSPLLKKLFFAPGNAGTLQHGVNTDIAPNDFEAIRALVIREKINMVVAGPEEPLVRGIHDYFLHDELLKNIAVIGPQKQGAMLEGSKEFSKGFMQRHSIPTARYKSFSDETLDEGMKYLESLKPPFVLKADGLAAGKGVLICAELVEAKLELASMLLDKKFGDAGKKVVIEEFLAGIELSVFVLTDGVSYKILPPAKDYKRIGVGDTGLNTGGMGAVSPVPFATIEFMNKVEQKIIIPTIEGLKQESIPYSGFLFIGLMNVEGEPFVIEYNVRMGDPETEAVLPRIKSDLLDLLQGVATQTLHEKVMEVSEDVALTVVLVAGGYPGTYEKGKPIRGTGNVKHCLVFHSGTKTDKETGELLSNGGRIITLTSLSQTIEDAMEKSFNAAEIINYEGKYFREDIGADLLTINNQ